MFRCIVAPVDGSAFGEHALPLAATLARSAGVPLHLVHVHEPLVMASGVEVVAFSGPWTEVAREHERAYLSGLGERVRGAFGIRVEPVLIDGAVAPALERYARDCGAGLGVMSTHGHTRMSRLWHHGVADQIARGLPIPVLLVRPEEGSEPQIAAPAEIGHILISLDGSLASEEAIPAAIGLGGAIGARFTLLRVVGESKSRRQTVRAASADGRGDSRSGAYLEMHARRMRDRGLRVETRVVRGEPAGEAILAYIDGVSHDPRRRVDLVAMSCRMRGSMARIMGAHTSDVVVRGASVPILLSHPLASPASGPDPRAVYIRA